MNDSSHQKNSIGIIAIGTATPAAFISQPDACVRAQQFAATDVSQRAAMERLYRKTRVKNRFIVDSFFSLPSSPLDCGPSTGERMLTYNREIISLASEACKSALSKSDIKAEEITHLVTVSCTGFGAPGFDVELVTRLGLEAYVERTHVAFMGCHGAFNGLRVAHALCAINPQAVVLLCAAEVCSVHFQYGARGDSIVSNALFADGAAALVMASRKGAIQYKNARSLIITDTADDMTWTIENAGFVMKLSTGVAAVIEKRLPAFVDDWLIENGLRRQDIKNWVVHPGGPKILDAVERSLGLDHDALSLSRQILSSHGNMSSPTVLFILEKLIEQELSVMPCVMLGFGPGLTVEAVLFA